MTVLICSVDSLPRLGGVSIMAHELSNAFADVGEKVVFVGPKDSYVPSGFTRKYHHREDVHYNRKLRAGKDALFEDERISRLFDLIMKQDKITRVLMVHPFHYAVGALRACRLNDVPISVWFHGYELRSRLKGEYPRSQRSIMERATPIKLRERTFFTIGGVDELLANSSYTADLLKPFRIRPPISITGCGASAVPPEISSASIDRRAAREVLGVPLDVTVLAYVGRLIDAKRVDRLIEIVGNGTNFFGLVVGDGPARERLQSLADRHGLSGKVLFFGRVDEKTKWLALRASEFGCLLSEPDEQSGQVEGFGISLLEAALAGAVPVSSGTGGMMDVVRHMDTGVVLSPSLDPGSAATVLRSMVSDASSCERLVKAAQEQIANRFNWTVIVEKLRHGWLMAR